MTTATRSTSIPISVAASPFWLVARIARPRSVRDRNSQSATVIAIATANAIARGTAIAIPNGRIGVMP